MMNLFRRKPQIRGQIGYYGLADWWLSAFDEDERTYIEGKHQPMGGRQNMLTKGNITHSTATVNSFLSGLSTWFRKTTKDRDIARRILTKAAEVADPKKDVLGAHFTYQALIEVWYRDRDEIPQALDEAIKACQQQIEIAPLAAKQFKKEYPKSPLPRHVGYGQLVIIYDKRGRYDEGIQVSKQAKKQGWPGDWDKRIERYEKKKAKQK